MSKDAFVRDEVPTENPHTCRQVICYQDGSSKWIWCDDTNITLYSPAQGRLVELGLDVGAWEYSEVGKVYDLPFPVRIMWKQRTAKSGRPYKDVLWLERADVEPMAMVAAALKLTFESVFDEVGADSDGDGSDARQRLEALAPLLAAANHEKEVAAKEVKALEEQLREQHADAYARRDATLKAYDELRREAYALVERYCEESGERGQIIEGWYQLNVAKESQLVLREPGEAEEFIHHLIRFWPGLIFGVKGLLSVNLDALGRALDGTIPHVLRALEDWVRFEPKTTPQINWSKLPLPDTDTEPLTSANGHEKGTADAEATFPDERTETVDPPAAPGTD